MASRKCVMLLDLLMPIYVGRQICFFAFDHQSAFGQNDMAVWNSRETWRTVRKLNILLTKEVSMKMSGV